MYSYHSISAVLPAIVALETIEDPDLPHSQNSCTLTNIRHVVKCLLDKIGLLWPLRPHS